jgi:hypothetical protein
MGKNSALPSDMYICMYNYLMLCWKKVKENKFLQEEIKRLCRLVVQSIFRWRE